MSKELEKFISANRGDFDQDIPTAKVWENIASTFIEKEAKHSAPKPFFKWSIAAAAAFILLSCLFLFMYKDRNIGLPVVNENYNIQTPGLPQVNEFTKMIVLKQAELKILAREQPDLYQTFSKDIAQLDSSYHMLKTQLRITPNKEMMIEAMIQNLQLQLNVLNQQLNIIHQIKQTKKDKYETSFQTI